LPEIEEVSLQSPVDDDDLPHRQEEDDGGKGPEQEAADGQLSPSGTLNR
jgi:hypothetical protein